MSILLFQIGQCGNQLGMQLFDFIYNDLKDEEKLNDKTCTKLVANAILIDMEPKVISSYISQRKPYVFSKSRSYCADAGSGNNWALGYNMNGPKHVKQIAKIVKTTLEEIGNVTQFILIHSSSGGTGAGLGTYLTEYFHEEYPLISILNIIVWGFEVGEIIVQNYNTLFTITHLYSSSDGILILYNDHALEIATKLLHNDRPSLYDINDILVKQIASFILPSFLISKYPHVHHINEMISQLSFNNYYKLYTIRQVPQSADCLQDFNNFTWDFLIKRVDKLIQSNNFIDLKLPNNYFPNPSKTVANILYLRGKDYQQVNLDCFYKTNTKLYCQFNKQPFHAYGSSVSLGTFPISVTMISNSQNMIPSLQCKLDKFYEMYSSKAYFHQFNKYGLDDDDFVDTLALTEQIIHRYSEL